MKRLICGMLLSGIAFAAAAGDHAYGPYPAAYVEECGSCHVAYPPALLTAPDWQRVMAQLEHHYGVDAGLAAPPHAAIAGFLQQSASHRDKHAAAGDVPRLTHSAWFRKEHGTLPAKAAAGLPAAAQCESCHTAADRGDYRESGLRLPAAYRTQRRKEH